VNRPPRTTHDGALATRLSFFAIDHGLEEKVKEDKTAPTG
jgi:hypothetical protein